MGTPNFTIPSQGTSFNLPTGKAFLVLVTILMVGVLGCLSMILAAVVAAAYLLNLAVSAVYELVAHLVFVYTEGDPFVKLLFWALLAFLLIKIWPHVRQQLAKSFSAQSVSATR